MTNHLLRTIQQSTDLVHKLYVDYRISIGVESKESKESNTAWTINNITSNNALYQLKCPLGRAYILIREYFVTVTLLQAFLSLGFFQKNNSGSYLEKITHETYSKYKQAN